MARLSTPTMTRRACVSDFCSVTAWLVVAAVVGAAVVLLLTGLVVLALGSARFTTGVLNAVVGAPRVPVEPSKVPVETESEKLCGVLVDAVWSGTVAAKVHWILVPLTLPFTEFTFSVVTVSMSLSSKAPKNWTVPLLFAQT